MYQPYCEKIEEIIRNYFQKGFEMFENKDCFNYYSVKDFNNYIATKGYSPDFGHDAQKFLHFLLDEIKKETGFCTKNRD